MATTFKVPSSPNKSIFEIDEFLGVDLTNSGTNVEERRSPNAPNMVRQVPGKVRKRTGYKDKIVFGDGKDINRALKTSDTYEEFIIEGTSKSDATTICELAEPVQYTSDAAILIRVQYYGETGKVILALLCDDGDYAYWSLEKNEPDSHYVCTVFNRTGKESKKIIKIIAWLSEGATSDNPLKIKSIKVVSKTTAHTLDEWSATKWECAPEDNGICYVTTTAPYEINGCHTLRAAKKGGNFALNLNRISNSSSSPKGVISGGVIGDAHGCLPYGQEMYLEFDYIASKNFVIDFENEKVADVEASETTKHFSKKITLPKNGNRFRLHDNLDGATASISCFALLYDKDDSYAWSQSPEDRGIDVSSSWFYLVNEETEYTWETSFTSEGTASSKSVYMPIDLTQPNNYPVDKPMAIDLELSTKSASAVESAELGYKITYNDKTTESDFYPLIKKDSDFSGDHYSLYIDPTYPQLGTNQSVRHLVVKYTFTTVPSSVKLYISYSNMSVKTFSFRESYYIPNKIDWYHVGNKLFMQKDDKSRPKLVYSDMNNHKSMAWQFTAYTEDTYSEGYIEKDYDNLYVVDGKTFLCCDGNFLDVYPMYGRGKIPTITISKKPDGSAGTSYEAINLLQPGFEETFEGDGTSKQLCLGLFPIDRDKKVRVWVCDPLTPTTWIELAEGVSFTVNYETGVISTMKVTPEPMITGEPNIRVRAYRTIQRYKDRINKCQFGELFGVNGDPNRIFLSGNPDYKNIDFWSDMLRPGYFPDNNNAQLGTDNSSVVGYAKINNYLAAFKDDYEGSQNVIVREGDVVENEAAFKVINSLQGEGGISPYTFAYINTEPLFLTNSGIFAITAQDITGDKYSQNRSFYLNGSLLKEENLENAQAVVFNDMYVLAINNKLYILDGLQATRTDKSDPYATRQYVGFYCTDVPANCLWTEEDALWFGTTDGKVCRFATDVDDLESYNDNGEPIYCCWETPDLDGKLFYKNKSFRYIAIRMMSALKTSVKLWAMARGAWSFIKEDKTSGIFFDFENINFESFSFSTDRTDKVAHSKIRVKKVDKARFKIENSNLNEPFGLMNLALEYVESGNYKG